ncbi:hypothetical protein TorRG33x02_235510 [Trema orientale]|uniref:Uncharacterized protein n=1 Tax=Trema orientale TaxID=63057 RepID=A0A2P5E1W4_TREOI|nr:hypothetical protein TorRG33x02_235510 [Trema orientale]
MVEARPSLVKTINSNTSPLNPSTYYEIHRSMQTQHSLQTSTPAIPSTLCES